MPRPLLGVGEMLKMYSGSFFAGLFLMVESLG